MHKRTIDCSRCGKIVDSPPPVKSDVGSMTAGYYVAASWPQFANTGEVYICDECVWVDQRYIAIYGERDG